MNKNVPVDVAVLGDCKNTLPAVTALLKQQDHKTWIDAFSPYAEKEDRIVIQPEINPVSGPIRMGEVARKVSEHTAHKAILVTDVGQNQILSARYFKFTESRSIVTSGGMGTMGFGLPAAIGATFGAPDRTVCLILGDGGLQMDDRGVRHYHGAGQSRENRFAQQQLPGQRPAVAGALFQPPIFLHADDESGLRENRRGLRHCPRYGHRTRTA